LSVGKKRKPQRYTETPRDSIRAFLDQRTASLEIAELRVRPARRFVSWMLGRMATSLMITTLLLADRLLNS
jgi:hypothetical protein